MKISSVEKHKLMILRSASLSSQMNTTSPHVNEIPRSIKLMFGYQWTTLRSRDKYHHLCVLLHIDYTCFL